MSLPRGGEREPAEIRYSPPRLAGGELAPGLKSYRPVQLFFLMRLSHFQRQKRECGNILEPSDWRMRLLNKALYSTFQDCSTEGVGDEAKLLLGQQQAQ